MPHQCTNCGYVFADGSKEMLSGCPECDGATFQFYPDDTEIPETPPDESPSSSSSPSPPDPEGGRVGRRVGHATSTVREWMSGGSPTESESDEPDESTDESDESTDELPDDSTDKTTDELTGGSVTESTEDTDEPEESDEADVLKNEASELEDAAQASARSEFVSPDRIPSSSESENQSSFSFSSSSNDGRVIREPTGDRPDLTEIREELNDQFESIKIIEPGQYELNLMELYDRDEYIIALQENGRYVIQMPETWIGNDDE